MRSTWLFVACVALAGPACGGPKNGTRTTSEHAGTPTKSPRVSQRAQLDLFVFGQILGTVAPCGCTTEPLGGLQYAFGYIEAHSQPGARLILEPGSFLFPDPKGAEAATDEAGWEQANKRAEVLHGRFSKLGEDFVAGLGPTDLSSAQGPEVLAKWPLSRVLSNAKTPPKGVQSSLVRERSGIRIGILQAVSPNHVGHEALGELEDPATALTRELTNTKQSGADLIIVEFLGLRQEAEALAKEVAGIDVLVVGAPRGLDRPRVGSPVARVGKTWLVEPGEKLQTMTHIQITADRKVVAKDLPETATWTRLTPRSQQQRELARAEETLAKVKADPKADPALVARLERQRDDLKAQLEKPHEPTDPVEVLFEQVKVTCHLQADVDAKKALAGYDQTIAAQNKQRFAGVKPPAPTGGAPAYVGTEECANCHDEAYAFWQTTRHAQAFKTLVDANKQFDVNCVGCHVTGFRQPGGSEVVENEGLRDIQCEQCHGPGSLHVEEPTLGGKPNAIEHDAKENVCMQCHTRDHSDTFEYSAYLRDVLGAGHGPQRRELLGEGPTGRELRQAGFEKAGGACAKH